MSAYYNEVDPFAAAWLRELIKAGAIAPGEVDTRSIEDVQPADLVGFDQCHFFAGIGVWSYALRCAGWPDDRPVWTGSCPCQPFSAAGKRKGSADERHLWPSWFQLIAELNPPVLFGEQVEAAVKHGWLDLVQNDLESRKYAVASVCFPAAGVGAPHIRSRLYFVADADSARRGAGWSSEEGVRSDTPRLEPAGLRDAGGWEEGHAAGRSGARLAVWDADWLACIDGKYRPVEPGTFPLAHGAPCRVGRLRGYGNAIVAPQAATFVRAYLEARYGTEK